MCIRDSSHLRAIVIAATRIRPMNGGPKWGVGRNGVGIRPIEPPSGDGECKQWDPSTEEHPGAGTASQGQPHPCSRRRQHIQCPSLIAASRRKPGSIRRGLLRDGFPLSRTTVRNKSECSAQRSDGAMLPRLFAHGDSIRRPRAGGDPCIRVLPTMDCSAHPCASPELWSG